MMDILTIAVLCTIVLLIVAACLYHQTIAIAVGIIKEAIENIRKACRAEYMGGASQAPRPVLRCEESAIKNAIYMSANDLGKLLPIAYLSNLHNVSTYSVMYHKFMMVCCRVPASDLRFSGGGKSDGDIMKDIRMDMIEQLNKRIIEKLLDGELPGIVCPFLSGGIPVMFVDDVRFKGGYWEIYVLPVTNQTACDYVQIRLD